MDKADVSFWLSIAGFCISVVLAIVKLIEFFITRRVKLKADASLTSSGDIGNTITILNASAIPVTISYFELSWVERKKIWSIPIPFTRLEVSTESPIDPPDGYDALVLPHQTHSITFSGEYHFDWGGSLEHDIYLKVWLVGQGRPTWLWVTGPARYR